jgi:excisionase family DNA binding protein
MKDATLPEPLTREEFLTARQLAALLQISETTVRRLAQKGRIPSIRLTTRILRFHLQSVRNALSDTAHNRTSRRHTATENPDEHLQLSFSDLL